MSEQAIESKPKIIKDISDPKTAGQYTPEDDTIHLNPNIDSKATLAEEYYHRRQDRVLVDKGVNKEERNSQLYLSALEVGIIPTIREIGLRKGEPSANYEFFRYVTNAAKFSQLFLGLAGEEKERFKKIVKGQRLFDGLAWVFKKLDDPQYDSNCWQEMALKSSDGRMYWEEISKSRKQFTFQI